MKILLVDVGTSRKELNEPLGIEVLGGVIRKRFPGTFQVDMEYYQILDNHEPSNFDYLFQYDIVSISTQLFSLNCVKKILRNLSTIRTEKKPLIILGGLLATFACEYFLQTYKDCICVIGEGEDAIVSILELYLENFDKYSGHPECVRLLKEKILKKSVPNTAFLFENQIQIMPRLLVDLEKSEKPARDFLKEIIERKGIIRIEGSRGCPWGKCSFCAISAKYGFINWRPFPIKKIIDELQEISESGGKSPYFTDEDFFGSNPRRALEIADSIIDAKNDGRICEDLDFYINLPISAVISHKKIISRLRDSGLREVFIGIESGARSQIVRYKKIETKKQNIDAINILRNMGISIDIGFIMFDPEMTFSDLKENISFIEKANLVNHDARDIKKIRVEPKTPLEKNLKKKGIISSDFDVDGLRYSYSFIDPHVQKVYDLFYAWEYDTQNIVYELQGQMRGEIESEILRNQQKKILGDFRELDYLFLKTCVESIENAENSNQMKSKFNQLTEAKQELIKKGIRGGFLHGG